MTNDQKRSAGRPEKPGKNLLIQIRVESAEEVDQINELTPRQRATSMIQKPIIHTGNEQIVSLNPPLPCSIIKGDGICGEPAYLAWAEEIHINHPQFPIRHQWILQPICRICAEKTAALYK